MLTLILKNFQCKHKIYKHIWYQITLNCCLTQIWWWTAQRNEIECRCRFEKTKNIADLGFTIQPVSSSTFEEIYTRTHTLILYAAYMLCIHIVNTILLDHYLQVVGLFYLNDPANEKIFTSFVPLYIVLWYTYSLHICNTSICSHLSVILYLSIDFFSI